MSVFDQTPFGRRNTDADERRDGEQLEYPKRGQEKADPAAHKRGRPEPVKGRHHQPQDAAR